jgi:hypothetical protein
MSPPEELAASLAGYKRAGAGFQWAWQHTLLAIALDERHLFVEARDAWRRAYEDGPLPSREGVLAGWRAERGAVSWGVTERLCAHCFDEMVDRPTSATYCSVRCRRDAAYERERVKARLTNVTQRNGQPSESSRGASEGALRLVGA